MSRRTSFYISFDAMFLALFIIFSFAPNIGYITFGPISFTTIHILVLIGALLFGKWQGLLFGTYMGILSLLVSLQYPGTVNYLFLNPFVSVLPRMLFGFLAGLIFDIFRKKSTFAGFLMISAPLCGILTLLHTVLTLSFLYVFGYLDIFYISQAMGLREIIEANNNAFGSFGNFIAAFIAPGSVCEIAGAIVLSPAIMGVLYKAVIKKNENSFGINVHFLPENSEGALSKKQLIIITVILGAIVVLLAGVVLFLYYYFKWAIIYFLYNFVI